jgi:hypothetical protein
MVLVILCRLPRGGHHPAHPLEHRRPERQPLPTPQLPKKESRDQESQWEIKLRFYLARDCHGWPSSAASPRRRPSRASSQHGPGRVSISSGAPCLASTSFSSQLGCTER